MKKSNISLSCFEFSIERESLLCWSHNCCEKWNDITKFKNKLPALQLSLI